jgi:hypothetical protein
VCQTCFVQMPPPVLTAFCPWAVRTRCRYHSATKPELSYITCTYDLDNSLSARTVHSISAYNGIPEKNIAHFQVLMIQIISQKSTNHIVTACFLSFLHLCLSVLLLSLVHKVFCINLIDSWAYFFPTCNVNIPHWTTSRYFPLLFFILISIYLCGKFSFF